MRTYYILLLTSYFAVYAQAQTAQIRWDVQQDRPVAHDVYVWQGETVDLLPRLVQGTTPVAVTNAPVEFRYREASLPTNTYRYVTAAANTNSGVLAVRWIPDYDAGAAWYDWQIIVGSNAVNPRAFGRIIMRTTIGWPASTNAPAPITLYPTRADLQAASNALAGALHDVTTNLSGRIGVVSQSVDAVASDVSALSGSVASIGSLVGTNRVTRWYDPELPTRWAEWNGGSNIVIYLATVSATNYSVSLSADFLGADGQRPAWTNNVWPFEDGVWHGMVFNMGGEYWYSLQNTAMTYAWDAYPPNPVTFPLVLSGVQSGTATVFSHYSYVTNIEWRYVLPLHAIPPELANLDNLQGWLNNLYAGKAALDNAIAAKEIHADSYTNLLWKSVYSNGWHWLVPYTNTP